MTDEVQDNGDNSQEKEEEQLGDRSAESGKNAGAVSKSVALSREANRAARALVMESNKLITEDVLALTKTYPACNALIEQQEIRIHNLMKKLMRKAGTGVQPPKLETAEVAQLIERTITATDNLCGDIHMIIDALDKAQRDEIVKIPKQVVGAESTRKYLTAEDKAAAIRRIATNLPSLLAQRMRQRDADMNTRKVAMHIEKPQKKYGFSFCIDNSEEPFKPKLVTKHHTKAPLASNLTVIDVDEGKGKRTWQSDIAQSLHPYAFELEHLKIPEQQLNSKKPIKSTNLEAQEIVLVDSKAKLDELIGILNKEREFAVDLEHHCDRSFLGLCCLVQISTRTTDFIVDPFPIWKDMHALNEPFTNPNILKVFHGSSSDVDWLQRDFGIYVVNMFDTYWAAKKLEFKKFSLAHIVSKIAGETLDKQYQLADWRVRPLPKHLISYARQDTHYLLYCYDVLREELLKKGIEALQFVYENSKSCCARVYEKPKFDSEKCLSLSKRQLNNQQMHALTGLSQWRNQAARSEDEGPEFVMPTYQMLHIAESLPRAEQEILACCYPLPPLVKQFSNEIYKIVWSARVLPQEKKSLTSASSDENRSNLLEKYVDEMNRMTAAKALLRCNIDFSHTNFDEEIGGLPEELLNDAGTKQDVLKKLQRDSYLPVLLGLSGSEKEIMVVGRNKYKRKLVNSIVKELEEWVSPYECYQILEKREAKRRKEEEEKNQEQ
ncbi:hypothetical protein WR25_06319 [Diploscapter pachys]|uniref:Exosome complex component 10 homolog n=1 Tax=Diploscapter pachys TaxID=2018661 RepID=A0A2A2JPC9_9BILA|nr:hypothetical protein WR25_06319 [Diploscapter pachys]